MSDIRDVPAGREGQLGADRCCVARGERDGTSAIAESKKSADLPRGMRRIYNEHPGRRVEWPDDRKARYQLGRKWILISLQRANAAGAPLAILSALYTSLNFGDRVGHTWNSREIYETHFDISGSSVRGQLRRLEALGIIERFGKSTLIACWPRDITDEQIDGFEFGKTFIQAPPGVAKYKKKTGVPKRRKPETALTVAFAEEVETAIPVPKNVETGNRISGEPETAFPHTSDTCDKGAPPTAVSAPLNNPAHVSDSVKEEIPCDHLADVDRSGADVLTDAPCDLDEEDKDHWNYKDQSEGF